MEERSESAALSRLLNNVLAETLDPEGCIPIWRLEVALREDGATRAHVVTCKHCQNLLSLLFQDGCPAASRIEAWALDATAPERAALLRHIERDECPVCREAFTASAATGSEHPTLWEFVRAQLGLLSGPRQELVDEHLGSRCEVCRNVTAAGGTRRLADLVNRIVAAGGDWRRIVVAAQGVSLAPQASYAVKRASGRPPLAEIHFPSISAVLHHDEDAKAITLDVTVAGAAAGDSVIAVLASRTNRWEHRIGLETSGRVVHGSAVVGSPERWIADDHVSVFVWLEDER
jgi:hypothetical protein